ncbi:MAG: hypothetical protein KDA75_05650, partial [Planctomycetaceae bacterium]|nr:hypothetical protein [Planctomycetaceae bacterium]
PRDIGPRVVLLRWGATAVIALLLWAPLWWSLQEVGGYGVVSTNHARYFVGLAGWWAARGAQLAKQSALDSGLGLGLSAVAITIPLFLWDVHVDTSAAAIGRRLQRAVQRGVTFAILAVALRGMLAAEVLLAVGLLLAESFTRSVDRDSPTVMHGSRALSWWTAVAWVTGLIVATPMYTPYPRLALPLACGSWLGVSILGRQPWEGRSISGRRTILQWIGISITLVLIPFLWLSRGPTTMLPAVAWEDQRGLEEMAGPIVTAAARDHGRHPTAGRQGVDAVLYVFAEPPLFYHLSALPNQPGFTYLVQPIGDHAVLERSDGSLANYVITGPHADAVATDAARFAKAEQAGRLRLVEELRYRPTTLVMLDQSDDVAASGSEQTVRLYRVQ